MQSLTFDQLKQHIDDIMYPGGRTGIYTVDINNKGKRYHFEELKMNAISQDTCGFGLNHYGWLNLPMPSQESSKFHDSEDVSVDIERSKFVSAEVEPGKMIIKTKTWTAEVTYPKEYAPSVVNG